MTEYILEGFQAFFNWIVTFVQDKIDPLFLPIADALPDLSFSLPDEVASVLSIINSFFPVEYGVTLLIAYFVFILLFIVVKVVKKFIPLISG